MTSNGKGIAVPITKIDKYAVFYSVNQDTPKIELFAGPAVAMLPVGTLFFVPNGSALPSDTITTGAFTIAKLHYHLEDIPSIIDLLRNEHPMYLAYYGSGPTFRGRIQTDAERVGEGET